MSNARVQATAEGMPDLSPALSPLERMQGLATTWLSAPPEVRNQILAATAVNGEPHSAQSKSSPQPSIATTREHLMPTPRVQAAAEGMPTEPDFKTAFHALEGDISRVHSYAQIISWLAYDELGEEVEDQGGAKFVHANGMKVEFLQFLCSEMEVVSERLEEQWLETHNAAALASYADIKGKAPAAGAVR